MFIISLLPVMICTLTFTFSTRLLLLSQHRRAPPALIPTLGEPWETSLTSYTTTLAETARLIPGGRRTYLIMFTLNSGHDNDHGVTFAEADIGFHNPLPDDEDAHWMVNREDGRRDGEQDSETMNVA